MQALRGGKFKIHGNINQTISLLSQSLNETAPLKVNLKRRLQFKSNALSLTVRDRIKLLKLQFGSQRYKEEGIMY